MFLSWTVSMLCLTIKTYDHRYWFEEVCFEPETNGLCSNHSLMVRRLNAVTDNQNLRSSVLIWKGLLRIRNQRFLKQPSHFCETSQCCPLQPKPMMIGTDLKRSASNLKATVSATTIFWLWNVSMLFMTAKTYEHRYWFKYVCSKTSTNGFCRNRVVLWNVSMLSMTTKA